METKPTKRCPLCGETILAVAKKCKHCGKYLSNIPTEPAKFSNQAISKQSILPLWLWMLLGFFAIFFVSILLWTLVFRDTWERDHEQTIKALADRGGNLVITGKLQEGLSTYDELFGLINNRHLTNKYVLSIVEQARSSFAEGQRKYETNVLDAVKPAVVEAKNLMLRSDYPSSLERYNAILKTVSIRKPHGPEMQHFVQEIQTAKATLERKIADISEEQRRAEEQKQKEIAEERAEQAKAAEEQKKRVEELQKNPGPAFEHFCKNFMSRLKNLGERRIHSEYKINLTSTSSLTTPYIGTLEFYAIEYNAAAGKYLLQPYKIFIVPENGRWQLRSLQLQVMETWGDLEMDGSTGSQIVDNFVHTPNP